LRKLFNLTENDDISEEFKFVTDLQIIEEHLFGKTIQMGQDYFVLRLYVRHNTLNTFGDKVLGRFASVTQEMGAAHLGVQIADWVVHWFNSGFAIPKEWKGGGATAVFYPQDIHGAEVQVIANTKENREAICKVIRNWNCTKNYNAFSANCQLFASDIFKALKLNDCFSKYEGWVGDFIRYISKYSHQTEELFPCLIKGEKKIAEWKNHTDLDRWHKENFGTYPEAASLIKAMHRAFQMRGDIGAGCPHDAPTLLVTNDGQKIPVHAESAYSNPLDTSIPVSKAGMSGNK